jgi:ribosomal protein S5
VQVHGTRNVRNTVKAVIQGFESQIIPEEQIDLPTTKLDKKHPVKRVKGVATVQTVGLLSI